MQLLAKRGCVIVEPTAWPSEQSCPLAVAAEQDLLRAGTDKAAAVLLDQMNGALRQALHSILSRIASEEEAEAATQLRDLLRWSEFGLHLTSPWQVVFAGPPNVGKSSLMNAISGQLKSIVHHLPGTTRDWIETEIALNGWPLSLTDTAGIREHSDEVEGEGVRRARQRVLAADLVVLVIDAQVGWTETHSALLELNLPSQLVVWNKADLGYQPPANLSAEFRPVPASTVQPGGIDQLLIRVAETLVPEEPAAGQAVPFRRSHVQQIRASLASLQAADFRSAGNILEQLTTSWIAEEESP
jgi:tRNA modification GTPase